MNVVISGSSRGIGMELVKLFCQDGHMVCALSRNILPLKALAKSHANLMSVEFDINKIHSHAGELTKKLRQHFGSSAHILINNAGTLFNKTFEGTTQEEAALMFGTNFFGAAGLIKALLPMLKECDKAHVINITSMGGVQGSAKFAGLSHYAASKAALNVLTECLAEEYKHTNIKFNALALGAVQTEMLNEAFPGYKAPLSAREMAGFITRFSLTGHNYFNGKILPVSLSTP
ncbi:MAG: SDR family oxidoreductase [Bacteroidales bacterium]|nr:SDR family oxidoreductase [Bacteroidales bacterium]